MNDSHRPLQRPTPGLSPTPVGRGPPARRPSWQIALFLMMGYGLVALALWQWSIRSPSVIWAPATHDPLGTVQTVELVGRWVTGTRIDTVARTVVVRGVARFQPGVAVELRSSFFNDYVCEVGFDSCYSLMPWTTAPLTPACSSS